MYLLDTNVISELRVGKAQPAQAVLDWAAAVPANRLYLSVITTLEIETGLLRLERRRPPQGRAIRAWFDGLRRAFAGRVLGYTEDASILCAAMHVPDPRPGRDAMIAAIAKEHGFVVVTRNVGDFEGLGIGVLDPWAFAG